MTETEPPVAQLRQQVDLSQLSHAAGIELGTDAESVCFPHSGHLPGVERRS